jgi:hypothetical protein
LKNPAFTLHSQKKVSKPVSRRQFILTTAAGSLGLAATYNGIAAPSSFIPHESPDLYALSRSLTSTWAKKLLDLQILDQSQTQDYGGIRCPTGHLVHGRVGDTIYPFLHMARRTGDHRYIDASAMLFRWMENNVSQPDGSWLNERKDSWKGTTVFSVIALCEALHYHGELLDPSFRSAIEARLPAATAQPSPPTTANTKPCTTATPPAAPCQCFGTTAQGPSSSPA